jgi:sugar phosphate isomerase/epimerase
VTLRNRREFLATLGAAAAGWACSGRAVLAAPRAPTRIPRVGLELYTVRGLMAKDLPSTIGQAAKIGYKEVEFAGYFNHPASEIRDILRLNGLTSPATHLAITAVQNEAESTFADAHTIGHEWIVVPSLPSGAKTTADDWKRIAAQFNKAGADCKAAGLKFGFHNHNTEFRKLATGEVPFDILVRETDPALVDFEMDLYWIRNGGGDPLDYFARFPGRFTIVHVKDAAPDGKMADAGAGTIDFKTIFARGRPMIRHFFVEHDNPPDPIASITASYDYLANLEY